MTCKVRYREGTGLTLGVQGKGIKNSSIFLAQHHILLAVVTMQKIKSGCSLVIPELWRLGFPGAASLLARDTLSSTTCHGKCLSMPWHLTLPASELILAAASYLPSPFPKSCHSQSYLGLQHQVGPVNSTTFFIFPETVTAPCPIVVSVPQTILTPNEV